MKGEWLWKPRISESFTLIVTIVICTTLFTRIEGPFFNCIVSVRLLFYQEMIVRRGIFRQIFLDVRVATVKFIDSIPFSRVSK